MISHFPTFSRVSLQDKQVFDDFNAQFPPYADWAFGTLIAWWDVFDDLEVSQLNNNIVIKSSYFSLGREVHFVLLGNNDIDRSIEVLFAYQKEHGFNIALPSQPKYTIDALDNPEHFAIDEDPNASEYIFSTKMHASLEGSEMSQVRWRVSQFNRLMENHIVEVKRLPLNTTADKMQLINTLHTWKQDIYKNDRERLEGLAMDRALAAAENIDLHCIGLLIDKKLEGFALYKHLSKTYANINHIKVSYNYPNIFRYMLHILAIELQKEGYDFLNGEQDLGIEGLRIYKSSLRPVNRLKKYCVRPLT